MTAEELRAEIRNDNLTQLETIWHRREERVRNAIGQWVTVFGFSAIAAVVLVQCLRWVEGMLSR